MRLPALKIVRLEATDSTNDDALALAAEARACLVWTLDQRRGRGSRGRSWQTPKDSGLALSIGLDDAAAPSPAALNYPLLAGVLLRAALASLSGVDAFRLKWPNDLLLHGRKLAGILCESRWSAGARPRIAIGMGVNLRRHPALAALDRDWASLDELAKPPAPETLTTEIAHRFPAMLAELRQGARLREAWLRHCAHREGDAMAFELDGERMTGAFAGLDDAGRLLLRGDDGGLQRVHVPG